MADLTIKIEAPDLAHAILELAGVLAMAISTEAAKFSMAHQAAAAVATEADAAGANAIAQEYAQSVAPPTPAPDRQAEEAANYVNVPDVVELRAAAQEKGKTDEGKAAIKALLVQFGSKSISEVPDGRKAEFLAALEAL